MPRLPSRPKSPDRQAAESFGRRAEALAAWYLRAKLFRIRDRRVRTPLGEIDLVAERGDLIVFVEVKARRAVDQEDDAVLKVNRRRLLGAARHYLARHPALNERAVRFDVILLAPGRWPRHVIGAFDAT